MSTFETLAVVAAVYVVVFVAHRASRAIERSPEPGEAARRPVPARAG